MTEKAILQPGSSTCVSVRANRRALHRLIAPLLLSFFLSTRFVRSGCNPNVRLITCHVLLRLRWALCLSLDRKRNVHRDL